MAKTWVDQIVERLTAEIASRVREGAAAPAGRARRPRRKLDMRCRVGGCRNRSKGPRFGFICDDHRKTLSKKAQQQARDKWNARNAA